MAVQFNQGSGLNKTFLKASSNEKGYFYESIKKDVGDAMSPEQLEEQGIKKVETKSGYAYHKTYRQTSPGKITALGERLHEGVDGKGNSFKYTSIYLEITADDETGIDVVQISKLTQSGGLSDQFKNLICILPNIEYSKSYTLTPFVKVNQQNPKYSNLNIFFNEANEDKTMVKLAHMYGANGDIPAIEKEEDFDGSMKYSSKAQDSYLYKIWQTEKERFDTLHKDTTEKPVKNASVQNTDKNTSEPNLAPSSDEDDLPF